MKFNQEFINLMGQSATSSFTYSVGDSYACGIIAYIFQPGDTGYADYTGFVTTTEIGVDDQWGPYGNMGASVSNLRGGEYNTPLITTGAGSYCSSITSGGCSDWVLPSKDELNKMYINRAAIGGFYTTNAFGVAYSTYWSSTEYSSDPVNIAWTQYFYDGSQQPPIGYVKGSTLRVRAIRYF